MERSSREWSGLECALHAGWLEPQWYVLFVRSNQEKRVVQHLASRSIEHFLPLWESVRHWQDRKVKLLKPLFPGYVFVRLSLVDRLNALRVPNVLNLVGTKNAPAIVSDEEIGWIKTGLAYGQAEPYPYLQDLKAGQVVLIKAGAMNGLKGTLVGIQNSTRVLVRINSISRAFAVEVEGSDLSVVQPA
ncbi:MAG TPA: UpxY family transcription antiterminator [Candidatus Angelobacter sp.]